MGQKNIQRSNKITLLHRVSFYEALSPGEFFKLPEAERLAVRQKIRQDLLRKHHKSQAHCNRMQARWLRRSLLKEISQDVQPLSQLPASDQHKNCLDTAGCHNAAQKGPTPHAGGQPMSILNKACFLP